MYSYDQSSETLPVKQEPSSGLRVDSRVARRYLDAMDVKEIMLNNLRYAVRVFGNTHKLADASPAGSAKYFDQILSGFQGKNDKTPRSMGKKVAEAVAHALGKDSGWMYQPHPELWQGEKDDARRLEANDIVAHYPAQPEPWPFSFVRRADIAALTPEGLAYVEGQLEIAIKTATDRYGTQVAKTVAA